VYFLAWGAHALTTPGVRLMDATLFAPYGGTLALGEYMPGYAPLSVPVIALTGNPVLAHNLLLVLSYALAFLGAAVLAARLTGSRAAGLVAGIAFAYAPRLLDQAYNVQTLAVFWFPWLWLALERLFDRPTWPRGALVAGLWLGLALSSLNVFVYGSVLAAVGFAVAVTAGGRPFRMAHLVRLGVAGAAAAGLLLVYVAPDRALAREWGLGRPLAEVALHAAMPRDLAGLPREPVLRRLAGLPPDPDHGGLVPGAAASLLALAGLLAVARGGAGTGAALGPYAAMGAAAAVLALGPTLATPWGAVPLPYRVLYVAVPGFDALRTPGRFLVFVDLAVALLAGAGLAAWLPRMRPGPRRWAPAALGGLILVESVVVPFPGAAPRLDPRTVPAVYRWLAGQDARTVVLGIPMGDWVNVAAAAFHLRPTVNGWSSFFPPRYAELVEAMERFPDERTLALVRGAGTDLVLVDRAWVTPERAAALAAFPSVLRPERAFPTHLVYRVVRIPAPGIEALEATAEPAPGRACITLRNPGRGWVPLYPLHRLHLAVSGGGEAMHWLPLDLPPGAAETACVRVAAGPTPLRVSGEVEDGVRHYRFAVAADHGRGRLEPARP
jgi:hypothetical protein